jgi:predicted metal-dependent hydrolase
MDGISTIGDAFLMTETKQLEIKHKGKTILYRWRVSSRARHYRVMVGSKGVELVTPEGVGHSQAEKFLRLHGDWVLAQLERVEKLECKRRPPNAAMANIPSGMTFIEGKPVRLDFRKDPKLKTKPRVEELPGCLRISTPKGGREGAEAALESFLKKKAARLVISRVTVKAGEMGLNPGQVSIRSQKTRWGSCSSKGTLSFNWRLVIVPPDVLDYVVIHELIHIGEHNHSRRFWEKVALIDPAYKNHRSWLKENQSYLYDPLIR